MYDNWWTAVRPDIPDLMEFKRQFKEKYWSDSTQNRIRMNLSNGKYDASKGQSTTSYFLGKICLARKLTPQIPEECLVEQLSKHYNKEIENSSRYNQFKKIQNLSSLLETCEQTGQYRDYQTVNYKPDSYSNNNRQNNNDHSNYDLSNRNNNNNNPPPNNRNNYNRGPNNNYHSGSNQNNYRGNNYNNRGNQGGGDRRDHNYRSQVNYIVANNQ